MSKASEKRYNVLVVDDDAPTLEGLDAVLSGDVNVTTCASPTKARTLLETQRFHVLCSDYQMPVLNGLQLIEHATRLPEFVACLLLTGADEYMRSESSGSHYVLLKPYDPARLITLVLQLARVAEMKRSVQSMKS